MRTSRAGRGRRGRSSIVSGGGGGGFTPTTAPSLVDANVALNSSLISSDSSSPLGLTVPPSCAADDVVIFIASINTDGDPGALVPSNCTILEEYLTVRLSTFWHSFAAGYYVYDGSTVPSISTTTGTWTFGQAVLVGYTNCGTPTVEGWTTVNTGTATSGDGVGAFNTPTSSAWNAASATSVDGEAGYTQACFTATADDGTHVDTNATWDNDRTRTTTMGTDGSMGMFYDNAGGATKGSGWVITSADFGSIPSVGGMFVLPGTS